MSGRHAVVWPIMMTESGQSRNASLLTPYRRTELLEIRANYSIRESCKGLASEPLLRDHTYTLGRFLIESDYRPDGGVGKSSLH